MLLVIFGAGASFDGVPMDEVRQVAAYANYRPPLARELFGDRPNFNDAFRAFPQFGGRLLALRRAARRDDFDVERELQAIRDEAGVYPPARGELAAIQFYIQRIISECGNEWLRQSAGATNYRELLARIDRWKVRTGKGALLATFNYDELLDNAVAQFPMSLRPNDINGYVSGLDYKLFKLHGSVNWGQRVQWTPADMSLAEITRQLIEEIGTKQLGGEYVISGGAVTYQHPGSNPCPWAVLPAIAHSRDR